MDPVPGAFDVDHLGGVEVGKPAAAHVRVELIAHEPGQARPLVTLNRPGFSGDWFA